MRKIDNQIIYHIEQRGRKREKGESESVRTPTSKSRFKYPLNVIFFLQNKK